MAIKIPQLNLFKNYHEYHERAFVGVIQTYVYLGLLLIAVVVVVSITSTKKTQTVFQVQHPTLQQYQQMDAQGLQPQCACVNSFISLQTFATMQYQIDGWCTLASFVRDMCKQYPSVCAQPQYAFSSTSVLAYVQALMSACTSAESLVKSTFDQLTISQFSSAYLLPASVVVSTVTSDLNTDVRLMSASYQQPFRTSELLLQVEKPISLNAFVETPILTFNGTHTVLATGIVASGIWTFIDNYQTQRAKQLGLSSPACTCEQGLLFSKNCRASVFCFVVSLTMFLFPLAQSAVSVSVSVSVADLTCSAPLDILPFNKYNFTVFCFGYETTVTFPTALLLDPDFYYHYGLPPAFVTNLLKTYTPSMFKFKTFGDAADSAFLFNYSAKSLYLRSGLCCLSFAFSAA